jgi:amidase
VGSAHGESKYWGYTSVFNILDYSAAVFPVGAVEDSDTWTRYPRSNGAYLSDEDKMFHGYYGDDLGPRKYQDAPVCLQLVTRRFREEALLGMVERIVKDLVEGKGA